MVPYFVGNSTKIARKMMGLEYEDQAEKDDLSSTPNLLQFQLLSRLVAAIKGLFIRPIKHRDMMP